MNFKIDYYSSKAVSQSSLKVFMNSREDYYNDIIMSDNLSKEAYFFEFGKLYHTLFLEPNKFKSEYVIAPQKVIPPTGNMRTFIEEYALTNDYIKAHEKSGYSKYTCEKVVELYLKDNNNRAYKDYYLKSLDLIGKKVTSYESYEKAQKMLKVLKAFDCIQRILDFEGKEVLIEEEFFYKIKGVDVDLKAKIDLIVIDHNNKTFTIYDLKTTKAKSNKEFIKSIVEFKYNIQASYYLVACKIKYPQYKDYTFDFQFIPQCTEEPYKFLGLTRMTQNTLNNSLQEWINALKGLEQCIKTNIWLDHNYDEIINIELFNE